MSPSARPPDYLADEDVRTRLEDVFRTRHRSFLIALMGSGSAGVLDTKLGEFRVVPVRSEIDLRRKLADVDAEPDPHVAFLVPWSGSLPLDIGGRFANGGRILPLGKETKLRQLFGAYDIDDAVLSSPLTRYVVGHATRDRYAFRGGRLTLDALWTTWLREEVRLFEKDDLSLSAMLLWAAVDGGGPAFRASLQTDAGLELRAALIDWLTSRLGPAAPVVWSAWESGTGARALELAIVLEGIAASEDPAVETWRTMKAQSELGVPSGPALRPIVKSLAEAAPGVLRALGVREGDRRVELLVAAADRRIDLEAVRRIAAGSRWLPSAWTSQLDRLGALLREAASMPTRASLDAAIAMLRELEHHSWFKLPDGQATYVRAEMAVRLLAWLLDPIDERFPPLAPTYGDVVRLSRWYAHDGGYVDWARRSARGSATNAFGQGVMAVLDAVDARRTALDHAFARALPRWIESQRPARQGLPIHQAVAHFVERPLKAAAEAPRALAPDRRFLVLLIDGMAWTQAVELMQSLPNWGPVAWNALRTPQVEPGQAYLPVLAHVPTVTEVSRASFFAGKDLPPGRQEPTSRDEDRWRNHAIARYFAPGDVPRLLLRAEGHTTDGSASQEALSAVRDTRMPVVAMVINAIDASLKGDTQQATRWNLDSIRSLRDLLDAARDAGRLVLLASDHGHVPGDRLVSCGSPRDAGARWRPWRDGDTVAPYEVAFPKGIAWAPSSAQGVILLADDEHRYGGGTHAGEHGGATLAEVVAPTVLLGYDGGASPLVPDPEMRVGAPFVPRWWYFEPETMRAAEPAPAPTAAPAKPPPQLSLLGEPAPPPEPPRRKPRVEELVVHPVAQALAKSRLFKELPIEPARSKRLLEVVSYLAGRDDQTATLATFAAQLGTLTGRAQGLVSSLAEALNVDGYALLWHDPASGRVHLDVAKLKMLYELP